MNGITVMAVLYFVGVGVHATTSDSDDNMDCDAEKLSAYNSK